MTKREYIQGRIRLAVLPSFPFALAAIAIMIFVQVRHLDTEVFWVMSYGIMGLINIVLLILLIRGVKCPDCQRSLCGFYLVKRFTSPKDNILQRCPHCGVDFAEEMGPKIPRSLQR